MFVRASVQYSATAKLPVFWKHAARTIIWIKKWGNRKKIWEPTWHAVCTSWGLSINTMHHGRIPLNVESVLQHWDAELRDWAAADEVHGDQAHEQMPEDHREDGRCVEKPK